MLSACSSLVVVVSSSKSYLENPTIDTDAVTKTQLPRVREFVADGSPRQSADQPEAKEQSGRTQKPSSPKERFISMPLWDFLIIIIIVAAVGYVIGAAHQYAALT